MLLQCRLVESLVLGFDPIGVFDRWNWGIYRHASFPSLWNPFVSGLTNTPFSTDCSISDLVGCRILNPAIGMAGVLVYKLSLQKR